MNCEHCRDRLGPLLEGELSGPDLAATEAHLAVCPDCQAYRRRLEQVDEFLALLPPREAVPEELTDSILRNAASAPAAALRRTPRIRRARPLVWATAAGLLVTAALVWLLGRSTPHTPEQVPPPKPEPRTVSARLYLNRTVGRLVAGASYRIYGPAFGQLFHDLTLLGIDPALSLNNLRIGLDRPHQDVTADASGRIRLDQPLGTGMHLVYVNRPGYLGAWGLIQPAAEPPDLEAVLFPAASLEISGRILDRTGGQPIAGAVVATMDGTGVAVTDADGRYHGRMEIFPGRWPQLYAFAAGHAEIRVRAGADAMERGSFQWDAVLDPATRHDLVLRLHDAEGRPVEGAELLAWPDLEDPNRPRLPPLRRRRPELGVTDGDGRVVLRDLLPCRYRLEVYHPRYDLKGPQYVSSAAGDEVELTARIGGDARLAATVERADGSPLAGARVVLTHIEGEKRQTRPVRVRSSATDLEGRVAFRDLRAGPVILQVITPEGCGYYLRFSIDKGDAVVFTYPLPESKHRISGEVSAEARDRYRMLRLQGDLPRVVTGRRKSEGHVLAVETPVAEDGSFRFPAVPSLEKAEIGGRLTRNPNADPDEVVTRPPVAEAVGREAPAASRIDVDRR